jgi:uncharacterized protein involved in response to NO
MRASLTGGIPRYRDWTGPALFRHGFRPFFFAAGLWAVAALALWLLILAGALALPTAFAPVTWHAHEMIFGFAMAAVAGFLLTAVPNWTGRMPLQGLPLMGLALLWLAGRVAVACGETPGPVPAALVDLAFPLTLLGVVLREVLAGRNWRNLPVAAAVAVLLTANLLTHLEAIGLADTAALGLRLAVATLTALITLIGGRVVPSFTTNWLKKRGETRLPAPFGRLDRVALALTVTALLAWTAAPDSPPTAVLALLAGLAQALRLARWRGHRTLAEPLVWVLHLGYAWVPIGLVLLAFAALRSDLVPQAAALHALTAGAVGTMTLAVMTRATLGHTGRPLTAGPGTAAIYALVTMAALGRLLWALWPGAFPVLLSASGLLWLGAFGLYLALYGPMLLRPQADQRPG